MAPRRPAKGAAAGFKTHRPHASVPPVMSAFSATLSRRRSARRRGHKPRGAPLVPLAVTLGIAAAAVALVIYLLWPTWTPPRAGDPGDPGELPVSIGATLFNVPTYALRRNVQKHSGRQERIDLDFAYPSLGPPTASLRAGTAAGDSAVPPIDVLFLSIAVGDQTVSPDERLRSIYPRYLDEAAPARPDELAVTPFRDGTPYAGEDLAVAATPALVARCTRDTATPGMCMSERRIGGADLTFRFPRQWLAHWQDIAGAMERLVARLHRTPG